MVLKRQMEFSVKCYKRCRNLLVLLTILSNLTLITGFSSTPSVADPDQNGVYLNRNSGDIVDHGNNFFPTAPALGPGSSPNYPTVPPAFHKSPFPPFHYYSPPIPLLPHPPYHPPLHNYIPPIHVHPPPPYHLLSPPKQPPPSPVYQFKSPPPPDLPLHYHPPPLKLPPPLHLNSPPPPSSPLKHPPPSPHHFKFPPHSRPPPPVYLLKSPPPPFHFSSHPPPSPLPTIHFKSPPPPFHLHHHHPPPLPSGIPPASHQKSPPLPFHSHSHPPSIPPVPEIHLTPPPPPLRAHSPPDIPTTIHLKFPPPPNTPHLRFPPPPPLHYYSPPPPNSPPSVPFKSPRPPFHYPSPRHHTPPGAIHLKSPPPPFHYHSPPPQIQFKPPPPGAPPPRIHPKPPPSRPPVHRHPPPSYHTPPIHYSPPPTPIKSPLLPACQQTPPWFPHKSFPPPLSYYDAASIPHLPYGSSSPSNRGKVIVIGKVYCDTCWDENFQSETHGLPGATVKMQCNTRIGDQEFLGYTDAEGNFNITITGSFYEKWDLEECKVALLKSSHGLCNVASDYHNGKSGAEIRLKSISSTEIMLKSGPFAFKPDKPFPECPHLHHR